MTLTPVWVGVRPGVGQVLKVCAFSVMHPGVREHIGFEIGCRERLEYRFYTTVLRAVWRRAPRRLVRTPLAYHAYCSEILIETYERVQLDSFVVDGVGSGCPM